MATVDMVFVLTAILFINQQYPEAWEINMRWSDKASCRAHINNMGSLSSTLCNNLGREVWYYFVDKILWLSVVHAEWKIELIKHFVLLHLRVLIGPHMLSSLATSQMWCNMPRKFMPVKAKQMQKVGGTNWLIRTLRNKTVEGMPKLVNEHTKLRLLSGMFQEQ